MVEELRRARARLRAGRGDLAEAFRPREAKRTRSSSRATGEPTYRLPDIAYHREKFRRGYDLMVRHLRGRPYRHLPGRPGGAAGPRI
ncbi:MAG: hypothetical protein MZV64_74235 [Ignavibacteriales bacterium]|nr:hypothetical protein [Ignavibacteriales bacterium]